MYLNMLKEINDKYEAMHRQDKTKYIPEDFLHVFHPDWVQVALKIQKSAHMGGIDQRVQDIEDLLFELRRFTYHCALIEMVSEEDVDEEETS